MTYRTFIKCFSTLVLVPVSLTVSLAGVAIGKDYFLKAGVTVIPTRTFNNPKPITMWGFASCTDGTFTNCSSARVPGPTLTVTQGDQLRITVQNSLNGLYQEPVSLMIPGLIKGLSQPMAPVWMIPPKKPQGPNWPGAPVANGSRPTPANPADQNDPAYRYRVRSFDMETAVGATQTYVWDAFNATTGAGVKEGTYLYQSGTHPAVQVQMGLFGPLIVYPPTGFGSAYAAPATPGNPGHPATVYNAEAVLLYSEIDPALHDAIATGHYGPNPPLLNPPPNWMTSTVNYTPRFFLINGKPYSTNSPVIPAGSLGQTVLLRFLNAGLATKVPTLQDTFNIIQTPPSNLPYMTLLAEDGYPVSWLKQQYSLLLPAGKTMDAVITTTTTVSTGATGANIALYDRRLNLTNSSVTPGGQLTYLNVGGVPAVNVFPTFVNFGSVQLFRPVQQTVTIKNNGLSALLAVNAAPACPPAAPACTDAAEFQTNTILSTIDPGKSAAITVYFMPTTKGPKNAVLHIASSDPNQPTIDIPLYAVGM
ncbi:MAG TPA: choice-of-anchor D domain-containing protein [Geobacteraceae bacterium]